MRGCGCCSVPSRPTGPLPRSSLLLAAGTAPGQAAASSGPGLSARCSFCLGPRQGKAPEAAPSPATCHHRHCHPMPRIHGAAQLLQLREAKGEAAAPVGRPGAGGDPTSTAGLGTERGDATHVHQQLVQVPVSHRLLLLLRELLHADVEAKVQPCQLLLHLPHVLQLLKGALLPCARGWEPSQPASAAPTPPGPQPLTESLQLARVEVAEEAEQPPLHLAHVGDLSEEAVLQRSPPCRPRATCPHSLLARPAQNTQVVAPPDPPWPPSSRGGRRDRGSPTPALTAGAWRAAGPRAGRAAAARRTRSC